MAEAARNSATMVVDQSSQGVHRQTHNKQRDLLDSIAADLQCETNNFNLNTWRPVANWQSQHITIGSWGGGKVPRTAPSREILSFHGFVRCAALAVISASTEKGSEIEVMFK